MCSLLFYKPPLRNWIARFSYEYIFLNFSHVSRYAINLLSVLFACSQALQDIGSFYRVGSKEKNFIQENKFSSQDSVKQE